LPALTEVHTHTPTQALYQFAFVHAPADSQLNFTADSATLEEELSIQDVGRTLA
jgi:hypothetical protein